MASPALQQIVAVLRAIPRRDNPSVASLRRGFEAMAAMSPPVPGVAVERSSLRDVVADRVAPPSAAGDRALLYLHGGGFVVGSPTTHRSLVSRLALAANIAVWVPDYRLAPEHPFPAGIDDAVAAYRGLLDRGLSPDRVIVGGDSAGGGLTMALLLALRDARFPLPAAAFCLSPWVDLTLSGDSIDGRADIDPWISRHGLSLMARHYLQSANPAHPLASPILADLSRLPPLFVQVGTAEVLHDDADRLVTRARAHGVDATLDPWEDMVHVWQSFPLLPEAAQAIERLAGFIRARLG